MIGVRVIKFLVPRIVDKECAGSGRAASHNVVTCIGLVLQTFDVTLFDVMEITDGK